MLETTLDSLTFPPSSRRGLLDDGSFTIRPFERSSEQSVVRKKETRSVYTTRSNLKNYSTFNVCSYYTIDGGSRSLWCRKAWAFTLNIFFGIKSMPPRLITGFCYEKFKTKRKRIICETRYLSLIELLCKRYRKAVLQRFKRWHSHHHLFRNLEGILHSMKNILIKDLMEGLL